MVSECKTFLDGAISLDTELNMFILNNVSNIYYLMIYVSKIKVCFPTSAYSFYITLTTFPKFVKAPIVRL